MKVCGFFVAVFMLVSGNVFAVEHFSLRDSLVQFDKLSSELQADVVGDEVLDQALLATAQLIITTDLPGISSCDAWYDLGQRLLERRTVSDIWEESYPRLWIDALAGRMNYVLEEINRMAPSEEDAHARALRCLATHDWRQLHNVQERTAWEAYAYCKTRGDVGLITDMKQARLHDLPRHVVASYVCRAPVYVGFRFGVRSHSQPVRWNAQITLAEYAGMALGLLVAYQQDDESGQMPLLHEIIVNAKDLDLLPASTYLKLGQQVQRTFYKTVQREWYTNMISYLESDYHIPTVQWLRYVKSKVAAVDDSLLCPSLPTITQCVDSIVIGNFIQRVEVSTVPSRGQQRYGHTRISEENKARVEAQAEAGLYEAMYAWLQGVRKKGRGVEFVEGALHKHIEEESNEYSIVSLLSSIRTFQRDRNHKSARELLIRLFDEWKKRYVSNGKPLSTRGIKECLFVAKFSGVDASLLGKLYAYGRDLDAENPVFQQDKIQKWDYNASAKQARVYMDSGDIDQAWDLMRPFDTLTDHDLAGYLLLGKIAEERGAFKRAYTRYEKAYRQERKEKEGYSTGQRRAFVATEALVNLAKKEGDFEKAVSYCIRESDYRFYESYYIIPLHFDLLISMGKIEEALLLLEKKNAEHHAYLTRRGYKTITDSSIYAGVAPYALIMQTPSRIDEAIRLYGNDASRLEKGGYMELFISELLDQKKEGVLLDAYNEKGRVKKSKERSFMVGILALSQGRLADAHHLLLRRMNGYKKDKERQAYMWLHAFALSREGDALSAADGQWIKALGAGSECLSIAYGFVNGEIDEKDAVKEACLYGDSNVVFTVCALRAIRDGHMERAQELLRLVEESDAGKMQKSMARRIGEWLGSATEQDIAQAFIRTGKPKVKPKKKAKEEPVPEGQLIDSF